MRFRVITLGCVAGLVVAPNIASAALSLQIGPKNGAAPTFVNTDALPGFGREFFDLIFVETAPTENEGLFAYDLLLPVPQSQRGKFILDGAERPDNFVLDVPSGATFTVAESAADHILINVSSNNDLADITTGKKAARVFYTLTASFVAPATVLTFDTDATVFGSGDPNRELSIPVDETDAGVIGIPEPAGLSILVVAGAFALRRRIRA